MKYCSQCGKAMQDEDKFCINCGSSLLEARENIKPSPSSVAPPIGTSVAGMKTKIIIGSLLAFILVATGLYWKTFGNSDAQVASKMELAVKYINEQKYDEAILAYHEVIKIDKKEVKAYQGLEKVYTIQGQYDKSQQILQQGLQAVNNPDIIILTLSLAGLYADKDDWIAAEKTYQEIVDQDNSNLDACQGLAMIYAQEGKSDQGLDVLRQYLQVNSQDYRGYIALAEYYISIGDFDQAKQNIIESMNQEMNQSKAYEILGRLYEANWQDLKISAASAVKPEVKDMLTFYSAYRSGNYTEAINIYEANLSQQQGNQKAKILAAICYSKTGDIQHAQPLIQELASQSVNEWLMNDIAGYYLQTGDKAQAIQWAAKSLAVNDANAEAIQTLKQSGADPGLVNLYITKMLVSSWKSLRELDQILHYYGLMASEQADNFGQTVSLSGIEIGDTYETVINKLGNPMDIKHDVQKKGSENITGDSLIYNFGAVGISYFSNRVIFIRFDSNVMSTDRSIRIGDSLQKVVDAYGGSYADITGTNHELTRVYTFNNGMLAFDYNTDTVETIRLYRTPLQRQYVP